MNDILKLPPLEHLRSFVVFVESAHIVEAAESLKISQPLLSKHLKDFEEFTGTRLFQFQGRKKVLTHQGHSLYLAIKNQMTALSSELHLTLLKGQQGRLIKIGGRREIVEDVFLKLKYEGSLSYRSLDSEHVEKELVNRRLDIGISQNEIDSDNLIRKKIWTDEFVLAWNFQIKVDIRNSVEAIIDYLQDYRCYSYPDTPGLREVSKKYNLKAPKKITYFSDWRFLTEAMKVEKSWAVVPIGYVEASSKHKFIRLPPPLNFESQFYVYYQKELSKLPWFLELISQLINIRV